MPLSIPHPNPLPQGGGTKNLPQKALLLEGEGFFMPASLVYLRIVSTDVDEFIGNI